MTKRVFNFYPGPATLPLPVLERAREEFLDFAGTGMSVIEISHRSKEWEKVMTDATNLVRELMGVPQEYKVLWLSGGASTQFFMVPLNLQQQGKVMEYVNTGGWSTKAIKEAKHFGDVEVIASSEEENFSYIPKNVEFSEDIAFAHITSNNTLYGTEWGYMPKVPKDVPLVSDMSSSIMDRPINVKEFGVIYAGAQKNLGPAGVTLVIVREDLLDRVPERAPTMQKWKTHAENDSLYNTPPVFPIYICKLALDYMKEIGGVKELEKRNVEKAEVIYDVIDSSDGFYKGHAREDSRSLMNITFTMASPELEDKCVKGGTVRGLIGLKGHRSVGGMRASIYNAMPLEGVKKLAEYLKEFQAENQ
ncbi:MAG: 3-phosphoserine/phosphohydroxythreonine transaminase [Candidatus Thorarchaeota archaeon SMTZ1-45]|nr:MAG: 3-phosphoserine/phosphohydroxythreonine aminotransferase [Candidatus Thorarchaeota archaeon SMTZ1-45]